MITLVILKQYMTAISENSPGPELDKIYQEILDLGITPDMNVNLDHDLDEDETIKWWFGQFCSMYDDKGWFAMRTLLNLGDVIIEKYGDS